MKSRLAFFLAVFFLIFSVPAFAEWFDGDVTKTDLAKNELTISQSDPITDTDELIVMTVNPSTVFLGVSSLKDIKVGDEVSAEVEMDPENETWKALSVEVPAAGE